MFKDLPYDADWNNDHVSFSNFLMAFITLFRCSTGEDWQKLMYLLFFKKKKAFLLPRVAVHWQDIFPVLHSAVILRNAEHVYSGSHSAIRRILF
jgi:hypothetical protein